MSENIVLNRPAIKDSSNNYTFPSYANMSKTIKTIWSEILERKTLKFEDNTRLLDSSIEGSIASSEDSVIALADDTNLFSTEDQTSLQPWR